MDDSGYAVFYNTYIRINDEMILGIGARVQLLEFMHSRHIHNSNAANWM